MGLKRQGQTNTPYLGAQGFAATSPGREMNRGTDTDTGGTAALTLVGQKGTGLSKNMRVIGFDPGLAATGWAVVDYENTLQTVRHVAHGVIKTESDDPIQKRVSEFCSAVSRILLRYSEGVGCTFICAESYQNYGRVFWNGVQTLYVIGALFAQCAQEGHSVHLISAKDSKRLIGVRDGQKATVQQVVQKILGLPKLPRPTHAADALCIALARLYQLSKSETVWSAA